MLSQPLHFLSIGEAHLPAALSDQLVMRSFDAAIMPCSMHVAPPFSDPEESDDAVQPLRPSRQLARMRGLAVRVAATGRSIARMPDKADKPAGVFRVPLPPPV